jgi:hypothetical protein
LRVFSAMSLSCAAFAAAGVACFLTDYWPVAPIRPYVVVTTRSLKLLAELD